ncbi:MAG: tRNA pseudouridine(55) synthase TruB [Treponema sp.]|nr:tRNA pseudouridine(55) synthase TruB [Treponema sp.]
MDIILQNGTETEMNRDGIVLLAKKSGPTSFGAIGSIKKALETTKAGHTGTLDSFAQGLLVVCTGRLTKLAGYITAFDKQYSAVIKFGEETDTLEYNGNIIKKTACPKPQTLSDAVEKFMGTLMQTPPLFSAIHVNGKRSSDIARDGKTVELPERKITVYNSNIKDTVLNDDNTVAYALIDFSVSKGTYIRSLARDIAISCGSSAHLIGLYRTKVGNFSIEDAAGYNEIKNFTIDSAIEQMNLQKKITKEHSTENKNHKNDEKLKNEILSSMQCFTPELSISCGFTNLYLKDEKADIDFCNGKPLRSAFFGADLHDFKNETIFAVFKEKTFRGLFTKDADGRLHHNFIIN